MTRYLSFVGLLSGQILVHQTSGHQVGTQFCLWAAELGCVQGDLVENGQGGVGGRGIEVRQAFLNILTELFPVSTFPSKYRSTALFYNSVPSSGKLKWVLC